MNDEKYVESNDVPQITQTSQSEGGQTRTIDTTINKDDAGVVVTDFQKKIPLLTQLKMSSSTGHVQEIREFLSKPVLIASGNLATTDTISTFGNVYLPSSLLNSTVYSKKIEGYFGMRATCVVRFQVNGTRFQQGRYMVFAVPIAGAAQNGTWLDNYTRLHAATLTQRTQLPGVELDIACDSVVELRLPFVSARGASLAKGATAFSTLYVVKVAPYYPLVAGSGDNVASYTLWAHFEDIELTGVATPQSAIRTSRLKKNATAKEQEEAGIKPISSGLSLISSGMSKLSTVPLLSAIAAPAAWVTDVASKAAWSLGYSKPANLSIKHKIERTTNVSFANADSEDNSPVLAYTSRNNVSPLPGFAGTDVDEMSLKYVATKYAYFDAFTWSDSQGTGTVLKSTYVNPNTFVVSSGAMTNAYAFTPLAFVSKFFMYYRGSIKMRFKLVKTEFHSGRLLVAFTPRSIYGSSAVPTISQTQYLHRQIIDVRNNNEFEIVLPYVALESYLLCQDDLDNVPTLHIYVLDPLIAPSTVSSSITVLMEVAGGDDIEFQVPRRADVVPIQVATYEMGDDIECGFSTAEFGGKKTMDIVASEACVGEHVTSFRQLLKIPCLTSVTDGNNSGFPFAHFSPFACALGYVSSGSVSVSYTYPDLYSILGLCYALHRGSVRIKMVQNIGHSYSAGTDNALAYYQYAYPTFGDWVINVSTDRFGIADARGACNNITQPFITTLNNGLEVTVPQYSRTHSRATADHIASADANINSAVVVGTTLDPFTLVVDRCAGTGAGYYFARCGGDDLEFGMFTSIPVLVVNQSGTL